VNCFEWWEIDFGGMLGKSAAMQSDAIIGIFIVIIGSRFRYLKKRFWALQHTMHLLAYRPLQNNIDIQCALLLSSIFFNR
jgi:hypothetical protein